MDDSHSEGLDLKTTEELKPETQGSKKRKVIQKTLFTVKIQPNQGKQRNEGPPSDCWSWRKYGQKPIKGSPYPRGYYKCSTSKGCSAKKQVERCKTDATTLIITYTSNHNHPSPDLSTTRQLKDPETQLTEALPTTPKTEEEQEQQQPHLMNSDEDAIEENFHYSQSPFNYCQDIIMDRPRQNPFAENLENAYESPSFLIDEEPLAYPPLIAFSAVKSEETDFYDELEELPGVPVRLCGA